MKNKKQFKKEMWSLSFLTDYTSEEGCFGSIINNKKNDFKNKAWNIGKSSQRSMPLTSLSGNPYVHFWKRIIFLYFLSMKNWKWNVDLKNTFVNFTHCKIYADQDI